MNHAEELKRVLEVTGYSEEELESIVGKNEDLISHLALYLDKDSNFLPDIKEDHYFSFVEVDGFALLKKNYPDELSEVLDKFYKKGSCNYDEGQALNALRKSGVVEKADNYVELLEKLTTSKLDENAAFITKGCDAYDSALVVALYGGDINHFLSDCKGLLEMSIAQLVRIVSASLHHGLDLTGMTALELYDFLKKNTASFRYMTQFWYVFKIFRTKGLIDPKDATKVFKPGSIKRVDLNFLEESGITKEWVAENVPV